MFHAFHCFKIQFIFSVVYKPLLLLNTLKCGFEQLINIPQAKILLFFYCTHRFHIRKSVITFLKNGSNEPLFALLCPSRPRA